MTTPHILAESGDGERDANGRFIPGHKGIGGRPKGIDFRRLVKEHRGEEGVERAMVDVFDALVTAAKSGDVPAARLLLDRIADVTKEGVGPVSVTVVTGVPEPNDEPPEPAPLIVRTGVPQPEDP